VDTSACQELASLSARGTLSKGAMWRGKIAINGILSMIARKKRFPSVYIVIVDRSVRLEIHALQKMQPMCILFQRRKWEMSTE